MKYLLTIQAEFEADDDPSARSVIKNKLLEKITSFPKDIKPEMKLRCIYEDKQPRLVNRWFATATTNPTLKFIMDVGREGKE